MVESGGSHAASLPGDTHSSERKVEINTWLHQEVPIVYSMARSTNVLNIYRPESFCRKA